MKATNFPNGLSVYSTSSLLEDLPWPISLDFPTFFEDFYIYDDAEEWDPQGAGADINPIEGNGGVLQIKTSASTSAVAHITLRNIDEVDQFEVSGRRNWFEILMQADENTAMNWAVGLQTYNASIAPTDTANVVDGIWFHHASATSVIELIIKSPSGTTTVELIDDYVAGTNVKLGWRLNSNNILTAGVNNITFVKVDIDNLPTVPIQLVMGVQTTENVQHLIDVDYVFIASER